jgi:hypothetical protein
MRMAAYADLNDDQRFLIDRLPDFEDLTAAEIRNSRYCTRCWFRESPDAETLA